ncbi:MAG: GNAT family N-acetyltransferase [Acidimicrobiia bacterium]|jgi:ribosomal protein S18 acetylase RimI-like enzyme
MSTIRVEALDRDDESVRDALGRLLPQLSANAPTLTADRLRSVVSEPSTHVVIARLDGTVVGVAVLVRCRTLCGSFGFIEDVVVDEAARGLGIGKRLTETLLARARADGLDHVDLTSRPARREANAMYLSLGFELRETNCYRCELG